MAQTVDAPNVAALAAAATCGASVILYGVLFYIVSGLAGAQSELTGLADETPALLRLLLLGSGATVLNVVALSLAALGLVLPDRRRILAWVVALISLILLFGIAAVVLLSVLQPAELSDSNRPNRVPTEMQADLQIRVKFHETGSITARRQMSPQGIGVRAWSAAWSIYFSNWLAMSLDSLPGCSPFAN